MIENYLSIQDTMAIGSILLVIVFLSVKWLQRKEGWGWKGKL